MSAANSFRELAGKSSGAALTGLLGQIMQHPDIFVFGEFLELPSVKAVAATKEHALLEIFAYDRYEHYVARKAQLPALTPAQEKKLKQLTIVSMAVDATVLPYAQLQAATATADVRELENLIISCIYAGVLSGKLDQAQQAFIVQSCVGRDVRPAELAQMLAFVRGWRQQADRVLRNLEDQQHTIAASVQQRRDDDAARAHQLWEKTQAVQGALVVEQKEGGGRSTTSATSFDMDDDLYSAASLVGAGGRRTRGRRDV